MGEITRTAFYRDCKNAKVSIKVERIHLNAGGYTQVGRYYGVGAPLFRAYIEVTDTVYVSYGDTGDTWVRDTYEFRERDYQSARAYMKTLFPHARIER